MNGILFSRTGILYLGILFIAVLLLPIAVFLPYLFFDAKMQILKWLWEESYLPFWTSFSFALLSSVLCFVLLSKFFRIGLSLYTFSATVLILFSAIPAILDQRHLLLCCIFLFACLLAFSRSLLRKILYMEFFDSKLKFWEELPKSIQGVELYIESKDKDYNPNMFFLSNLGKKGCFLFRKEGKWSILPSSIRISFGKGRRLSFDVEPVLYARNKKGIGLRFKNIKNKSLQKNFYDYLNNLQRIGYVQN